MHKIPKILRAYFSRQPHLRFIPPEPTPIINTLLRREGFRGRIKSKITLAVRAIGFSYNPLAATMGGSIVEILESVYVLGNWESLY